MKRYIEKLLKEVLEYRKLDIEEDHKSYIYKCLHQAYLKGKIDGLKALNKQK